MFTHSAVTQRSAYTGTSIAHYTDKSNNRGPIGVSLDGMPYENVTWKSVGDIEYQQQMWFVDELSSGDHQIVVTNVGTGDPDTSIMGVDYFTYVGHSFIYSGQQLTSFA